MKHLHKDIDWSIFEFLEGNLSSEEAQYVQKQIDSNAEWNQAHARWKTSYLEPETLPYPNISELSQPKSRFKIFRNIPWYVAAASVFIVSIWFFGTPTSEVNPEALTVNTAPVLSNPEVKDFKTAMPKPIETDTLSPRSVLATSLNRVTTPQPAKKSEIHNPIYPVTLNRNPNAVATQHESHTPGSAVRELPPKIATSTHEKDPSQALLASFFPEEIRAEARFSWAAIESKSDTEASINGKPQRISTTDVYIDTGYFQDLETPTPKWQQIWRRTKKGELPVVKLALETHPNSWIPSMNINLRY